MKTIKSIKSIKGGPHIPNSGKTKTMKTIVAANTVKGGNSVNRQK